MLDQLTARLASTGAVLRSNLHVERPDRLTRALLAMTPWGPGPAGALAAGAARYPGADALVDDDGRLTYRELADRTDAIASELQAAGVGPDLVVGVLGRNGRTFVESLLAAAKTGADLVLLNTGFAGPQLADVVAAERIDVILHDAEFGAVVAESTARAYDATAVERMARGGGHVGAPRRQGRLVILTSGTTGRPKGANRRFSRTSADAVAAVVGSIPLQVRDTQVVAAPLFHGWGLTNLLLGMGRAATTVVSRTFDPLAMLEVVERERADVLVVVPVMLQRMLALGPQALIDNDTTSLRVIAASGSALGSKLVSEVLDRFGPVLYNLYGSTEVAVATVAGPDDLWDEPATAGRVAMGARVEIIDQDGNPVPRGTTGRVFVGSSSRFEGYTTGGGKEEVRGLLSSGDLGHFDEAGRLFIDGRDDDMIVSGGENVFPFEVEELLSHHPEVADVAVVGIDDEEFGSALAAFVVRHEGATLDEDGVRAHVRAHLARFKVPRRIEFLDQLPRSPTGKVLKRVLAQEARR
ncbi:MAG: AMP-binding protein [Acidimicrobiia bacterium]